MRIAIWHNLPSGGGKRALHDQILGLLGQGHHVECWCPSSADRDYLPLKFTVEEHELPFKWTPPTRLKQLTHSIGSSVELRTRLRAMDRHCRECAEQIHNGRFDLLYVAPCRFFRTSPIGRYVRLPKVLYLQEPYRWLYEALPSLPWPARPAPRNVSDWPSHLLGAVPDLIRLQALRLQAREEVANAASMNRILVNSYFSRESVLRAYGLDSHVSYLGVDTNLFAPSLIEKDGSVVGVGAIFPEKNISLILRAMAMAKSRSKLVWIGNSARLEHLTELQQLASSLGVEFQPLVNVSDVELVRWLSKAALMAYAPRLEPFGFAPLEANACGLPVVAVNEGGVRETVVDGVTGLLVDHDPRAMALAIDELLLNPERAQALGMSGRNIALQKWSLEAARTRLERHLSDVLEDSRRH